jgi:argininosuccinate lyase
MSIDKIWSGRFSKPSKAIFEQFSRSVSVDQRLFDADIALNKAWANALSRIGVYSQKEAKTVRLALDDIAREFHAGKLEPAPQDEDIHSANERWLTQKVGELGEKIHAGKSRNDQVMTGLRIVLKQELYKVEAEIRQLQRALIVQAENHIDTIFPGYTHVRQAQPISFAHYLCSLGFQLSRDCQRLQQCVKRVDVLPLGAGALAGSAFAIDREELATELTFSHVSENSIDATADRDICVETVYICTQVFLHLSRIAEDFIFWSSETMRFIEIDESYTTGSSMMPQKKNPDSLELIRGKTGRIHGDLTTLITLMKGLPTAYARDLQEDKEPLFDALDQTHRTLLLMTDIISTLIVHPERMKDALEPGLYATDLADDLVRKGVPFRQAHHIVGSLVAEAESLGVSLTDLPDNVLKNYSEQFADIKSLFDPVSSIDKRNVPGGTSRQSVNAQIKELELDITSSPVPPDKTK